MGTVVCLGTDMFPMDQLMMIYNALQNKSICELVKRAGSCAEFAGGSNFMSSRRKYFFLESTKEQHHDHVVFSVECVHSWFMYKDGFILIPHGLVAFRMMTR